MYDNSFEQYPDQKHEEKIEIPPENDFEQSFASGVPEFAGDQPSEENIAEFDEGIADAAAILNYGIDAVAREKGVKSVIQGIKDFDASRSSDPIGDLLAHLEVDDNEERDKIYDQSAASKPKEAEFREEYGMPVNRNKTKAGAYKAIENMKEIIMEVEGADPRYEELRAGARANQMDVFEFAVKRFGYRGLTELFSELTRQKKKEDTEEEPSIEEQLEEEKEQKKEEELEQEELNQEQLDEEKEEKLEEEAESEEKKKELEEESPEKIDEKYEEVNEKEDFLKPEEEEENEEEMPKEGEGNPSAGQQPGAPSSQSSQSAQPTKPVQPTQPTSSTDTQ